MKYRSVFPSKNAMHEANKCSQHFVFLWENGFRISIWKVHISSYFARKFSCIFKQEDKLKDLRRKYRVLQT